MNYLQVFRLSEHAILPTRKFETDAGLDLYACLKTNTGETKMVALSHGFALVPTLIAVKIPKGYVGIIKPKSKNNFLVGGGVIDSGYRGQLLVKVSNISAIAMEINHGDPIGQLLIVPIETPKVMEVPKDVFYNEVTERGDTGGIVTQYKTATFNAVISDVE